jgi:nucleoside-diphosphate-sugar epimerase
VSDGADVRALCRYTSERSIGGLAQLSDEIREQIDVTFGDLLDRDFVAHALEDRDLVFHLGASISVPYSYAAPREVVTTNVVGTLNILTAALKADIERIVQASSSEVYGTAQYIPIDENHPLHAQSPYAASKVGADKLAETFNLSFGLPVVIARPFNTFGPRQSLRAVIPTIITQALVSDEIRLGETTTSRDFVYVTDTVDALSCLGRTSEHAGETFNISTGEDVSIASVVDVVGTKLGRTLRIVHEEQRFRPPTSEVFRLLGSAQKIERSVGWKPRTSLPEGIGAVVDWMAHKDVQTRDYRI